jgi:hypothetical protein
LQAQAIGRVDEHGGFSTVAPDSLSDVAYYRCG